VALQGTLDTFALPDVLRLLASTKKTGRLRVSGTRGTGSVWVDGGGVVATEATGLADKPAPVDVLFELLRYGDGSFTFEAGTTAADPSAPSDVEPLLIEAEHQLLEWREIEAVVPSMDAWVTLVRDLPRAEVVVDGERWKTIVTVGSGTSVAAVGQALGLGEVAVCRLVKDLVEQGLGSVSTTGIVPAAEPVVVEEAPAPKLASVPEMDAPAPAEEEAPAAALGPYSIQIPGVDDVADEPAPIVANGNGNGNGNGAAPVVVDEDDAVEADEVARQLASLSPKAARAVAAAARAETDEEREAALAQVTGEDDEPINRGLLLKFLSSVRS